MIAFAVKHPIITLLIAWAAFGAIEVVARGYQPASTAAAASQ